MAIMALVIEDQADARLALKSFLEDIGYGVWEAPNGADGVESAATDLPDVIILDFMLPDMSGLDVLGHLKQQESTRTIPVVVVSAVSRPEVIRAAVKAGASDYIIKPWADNELETVLEWVLKRSGKNAPLRGFRTLGRTPDDFSRSGGSSA